MIVATCGHRVEIDVLVQLSLKDFDIYGIPSIRYVSYCNTCACKPTTQSIVLNTVEEENEWLGITSKTIVEQIKESLYKIEDIVWGNVEKFEKQFTDLNELISFWLNSTMFKVNYVLEDGQHITNEFKIEELDKWIELLKRESVNEQE